MRCLRMMIVAAVAGSIALPALADDIADTIDEARKAYLSGDLAAAKQSLDLASQLIGQKNAEGFAGFLPEPLQGWKADKAQATATAFLGGVSAATRIYTNAKGDTVEVSITGDSALLAQFGPMLANPAMASAMGKVVKVGNQRGLQTQDGDIMMMINNKFLVNVQGSADAAAKLTYAQAVDVAKLSKM
jgi:hypothetical protein